MSARESRREDNERVIRTLLALWNGIPDQRFGQMMMNLSRIDGGFADTWEWSNDEWIRRMEEAMCTWASYPPVSESNT